MYREKLITRKTQLEGRIKDLQAFLSTSLEGKLRCQKDGRRFKYFRVLPERICYLKADERNIAHALAEKGLAERMISDCEDEIRLIETQMKLEEKALSFDKAKRYLMQPGIRNLLGEPSATTSLSLASSAANDAVAAGLGGNFSPANPALGVLDFASVFDADAWESEPYETNPYHPEHLNVRTINGRMVRSKSESLIYQSLHWHSIPRRYEAKIQLVDGIAYADFLTVDPKTNQYVVWEHFGMMDDPTYREHAVNKIRRYLLSGFVPMKNLILTFETSDQPLDTELIEMIINYMY